MTKSILWTFVKLILDGISKVLSVIVLFGLHVGVLSAPEYVSQMFMQTEHAFKHKLKNKKCKTLKMLFFTR